jgi:hypothetical protein
MRVCLAVLIFGAGAIVLRMALTLSGVSDTEARAADDKLAADRNDSEKPKYTADGKLIAFSPDVYREWIWVGEPVTPNDLNGGEANFPEFHDVYVNPTAWREWKKTGKFPEETVLIKELTSVGSKQAPSGNGYFQGEFTGLEAAVQDSTRFKDEPGNWAYFSFGHTYPLKAEVGKNTVAACSQCHQDNAKKTDLVFSQYYAVLRDAAPKSK